jgi:polyvinyl alcohol dehydrogenase (cytochrome)
MRIPACILVLLGSAAIFAAPDGAAIYKKSCAGCHDSAQANMPNRDALKAMSPEAVDRALVSGAMRFQGSYLSVQERRAVAEFVTAKGMAKAVPQAGRCSGAAPKTRMQGDWNGWSIDVENSRYQPAPGLSASDLSKLKIKWTFGFPGDFVAFSQPTIYDGRVFVGSAGGTVYSLDAASGCMVWSFEAGAGVRTAVSIGPGPIAYFGDLQANVYAVDANTGAQLWKTRVDPHPVARITGSPKLYDGRLYVPVASHEEWTSSDARYECCTFRGSVAALDARTGRQIWKTYTIAEEPRPTRKSKAGGQLWGPAGGGVWGSPTLDLERKVVYVGTGDGYADPPVSTTDAILALDMESGKLLWSRQLTEKDVYNVSCLMPGGANCPDKPGPDFDFGAPPILRSLGNGKRALIASQKSGVVHALDPDQQGEILWQTRVGKGGVLGGIQWGPAADSTTVYVALSDLALQISDFTKLARNEGFAPNPNLGGGLFALRLSNGEKLWETASPGKGCERKGCSPSQSAAVSLIPGVVFSGALDGHLRAYSTNAGKILWDYDTVRDYTTVNQVTAHGGSLDGPGPVIAGGMLFVNSGYGYFNAMPGNVLLAFSVDGR